MIKLDYTQKTANMPSNSKSKKSIRKMKQQKVFELHLEKFSTQEFNFCWRSTLSLGAFSETGRLLTMHSVPQVNGMGISTDVRKRQMVNHFATLKDLTTKNVYRCKDKKSNFICLILFIPAFHLINYIKKLNI